jgi:hypothetical protein
MSEIDNEQFAALTDLLNFCRRAERTRRLDVGEWQRLRDRMNKAFITPGPPRIKAGYGLISDLMKGVPVEVVRKRFKVSRGTVYRMIRDHPELAKIWEPRFKKWEERRARKEKQPEPAADPVPVTAQETTHDAMPDVLVQFLASHEPKLASTTNPVGLQRMALECLLSNLGLVSENEFDGITDEELVARVTAFQIKDESQPDAVRKDAVESPPPPPTPPAPVQPSSGKKRFQVSVRGLDELLTWEEAANVVVEEIAQNLEPFAEMDVDHPFFTELKSQVKVALSKLLLKGRPSVSSSDIPEIARSVVRRMKDKTTLPQEVLEFAGLVSVAEQPIESPGDGVEDVSRDST